MTISIVKSNIDKVVIFVVVVGVGILFCLFVVFLLVLGWFVFSCVCGGGGGRVLVGFLCGFFKVVFEFNLNFFKNNLGGKR